MASSQRATSSIIRAPFWAHSRSPGSTGVVACYLPLARQYAHTHTHTHTQTCTTRTRTLTYAHAPSGVHQVTRCWSRDVIRQRVDGDLRVPGNAPPLFRFNKIQQRCARQSSNALANRSTRHLTTNMYNNYAQKISTGTSNSSSGRGIFICYLNLVQGTV